MEKGGKDFSFVHLYVDASSDICRSMQQGSENRLEITCGFLKEYLPKDEDVRKELDYIHDFFWNKVVMSECGSEDDEEELEPEEDVDGDSEYCGSERKLENVKRRILEASGHDFIVVVVESIDGDKKQAQAQVDGKTIKICKGIIEDLDEDELAGIIAHEVAHLEKRTEKNSRKEMEIGIEDVEVELKKINESMKNSGTGKIARIIAQVAVVGIGVIGGTVIAKGESRKNEDVADSRAVDILYKAGYNPESGADALEKIDNQRYRRRGLLEDVLSTHSETKERTKKIREKAKNKEERDD